MRGFEKQVVKTEGGKLNQWYQTQNTASSKSVYELIAL